MSFVSSSVPGTPTGTGIEWIIANLAPGTITTITLVLQVDNGCDCTNRNWVEITSDSAADYGIDGTTGLPETDEDSTPDTNVGYDNDLSGIGINPNDAVDNHNDITLDTPAGTLPDGDYTTYFILALPYWGWSLYLLFGNSKIEKHIG